MAAVISKQLLTKMLQLRQEQLAEIEQWVDMWIDLNITEDIKKARQATLPDFIKESNYDC